MCICFEYVLFKEFKKYVLRLFYILVSRKLWNFRVGKWFGNF